MSLEEYEAALERGYLGGASPTQSEPTSDADQAEATQPATVDETDATADAAPADDGQQEG